MTTILDRPEVAARQSRFRFASHRERGELLLEAPADLSPAEYWTAVRDAWQDSDRQPLRRRIIALLNERSEAEVLVFPSYVYGRVWHPPNGGHRG